MSQLTNTWSKTEALLSQALSELEDTVNGIDASHSSASQQLYGSRDEAVLFLHHNEFELAWEALAQVGKRERPPYRFWLRLLEAADVMGFSNDKVNVLLSAAFGAEMSTFRGFPAVVQVYINPLESREQVQGIRRIFSRRGIRNVAVIPGVRALSEGYSWVLSIEVEAQSFLDWFLVDSKKSMRRFLESIRRTGKASSARKELIKLRDTLSHAEVVLFSSDTPDISEEGFLQLIELDWASFAGHSVRLVYNHVLQRWDDIDAHAFATA